MKNVENFSDFLPKSIWFFWKCCYVSFVDKRDQFRAADCGMVFSSCVETVEIRSLSEISGRRYPVRKYNFNGVRSGNDWKIGQHCRLWDLGGLKSHLFDIGGKKKEQKEKGVKGSCNRLPFLLYRREFFRDHPCPATEITTGQAVKNLFFSGWVLEFFLWRSTLYK